MDTIATHAERKIATLHMNVLRTDARYAGIVTQRNTVNT